MSHDDQVQVCRERLAARPSHAAALLQLAMALHDRYEDHGDPADLHEAIGTAEQALTLIPPGHPDRGGYLTVLGHALRTGVAIAPDEDRRDRAITLLTEAHRVLPGRHEMQVLIGDDLAMLLSGRFRSAGDPADLDRAIAMMTVVVGVADPDDPDRPAYAANLGGWLHQRFDLRGQAADARQAVAWLEAAVTETGADDPYYLDRRDKLADALCARGRADRAVADVDQAIKLIGAEPNAWALSRLDAFQLARFELTGDLADLAEAVRYAAAAADAEDDAFSRVMYRMNHANRLLDRFAATGRADDLDAAVGILAGALDLAPDEPALVNNYGLALSERYRCTGELSDLETATRAYRRAADLARRSPISRAMYLNNLGTALTALADRTGVTTHEAIAVHDEAARLFPPEHPLRRETLGNLALALREVDLDRAVTTIEEAVTGLPADHPAATGLRTTETGIHQARFERTGDRADLGRALAAAQAALDATPAGHPSRATCLVNLARAYELAGDPDRATELTRPVETDPVAPFPVRIEAAFRNGRRAAAAGRWGAAADSFATMVRLLATVTRHAQTRGGQEQLLADWTGVPFTAAACALNAGRPADAVTVLEQGRGVLWAAQLARPAGEPESPPAATAGPVVLLTVSPYRCDALIVTGPDVRVVPLRTLTQPAVLARMKDYYHALGDDPDEPVLTGVLEWLWDHVAEPVLAALGPRVRHVTWCPTGPFALLPVHAAGYHRPEHAGAGRSVLDRVVSSYTATLRAAARPGAPCETDDLLFVGMPELPGAAKDSAVVRGHLGARCEVLEGPAATRAAVRAALDRHSAVHFSCHGRQDLDDPSAGGVILRDGVLSVADLAGARRGGEFAFLSACETAIGLNDVVDEAVTLAAALQYAGWRHVIATLWSVRDRDAAFLAEAIYARMVTDGRLSPDRAADALHHAVCAVRERRRNHPSRWVPFIHVGPPPPG
ncbi:tetratricopeptide (TPR) repeat protein [Actinoplanes octamycinicus]|uniref:Tetratricopeptide (TPR) repeat protein n=1 Tax=Actinoplanes octamycinicus TaxID=135948 RepID=A0A7W7H534_9ACTN|nr:CHAT domain-containing tetratricopeptide repeat protein [Actinoplanes octamycinicus]MBB4744114.1 tetratricopeptide (TPR) repeat protein [Actinoplanes octamycinicus]GIE56929.1 hypothetical protein Aoc01nite_23310 [Actinoplanes octamycinicus]